MEEGSGSTVCRRKLDDGIECVCVCVWNKKVHDSRSMMSRRFIIFNISIESLSVKDMTL